jgi:CRP/FNR family cyclic AMP-dependent transcriptional regulator
MAIAVQTLSKLSLFSRLGNDALLEIAPHIHERTFSPGQVIILEGEPCQAVYFVARGVVRTCRLSPEGREQVLAYLGPGEPFNLVPALDGEPNLATVDAVTDATLYTISCEHFRQIMRDHHEVALAVIKRLAAEVRRLSDMVEDLALHTVRTRLARFLLSHADGKQPPKRWTQEEVAAQIGTVRDVVGRTLRTFADDGLIRRERGRLVVMDRARLEREAMMNG